MLGQEGTFAGAVRVGATSHPTRHAERLTKMGQLRDSPEAQKVAREPETKYGMEELSPRYSTSGLRPGERGASERRALLNRNVGDWNAKCGPHMAAYDNLPQELP